MKRLLLAVFAVASFAGVGSLSAQGVRFGVGGGLLMPMGDYKTGDKAGLLVGADGTYWLSGDQIGIRLDASYSQTSEKSGVLAHKTKMIGGMGEVVYAFMTKADQIRPYLFGGIGLFNVKLSAGGADTSETKVGFGGGGGLAFKVGSGSTRIFVEGRYTSVKTFGTTLPFLGIKAGVRFGGK
jgi:opacity protein-like surface antigen